jgi:lysophospholipase L1-like esterase
MVRFRKSLLLCMVLVLVLAGCSRGPVSTHRIQQVQTPQHVATIAEERNGAKWWMKRNRELNAIGASNAASLVFFGDSIMEGWEHIGRKSLAIFSSKYPTAVMGMGGDGTQHALWRAEQGNFKHLRPRLVVIMIGTNNLGSQSPLEIVDGVTAVVQAVNAVTPDSRILVLGLFPRGDDHAYRLREPIRQVNEGFSRLADHKTIFYRDFGALLLNPDGTAQREIQPDHLHLSRKGYRIWAEAMFPVVEELIRGSDRDDP